MVAGNGAQRSDRIERVTIRSLHYVTFPAAIHKIRFDEAVIRLFVFIKNFCVFLRF